MSLASLTNAATTATTFANDARKKSPNLANMAATGGTGIANMATLFTEGARVRVTDGSSRLRKKGEDTVGRLKTKTGLKRLAVKSDSSG